MGKLIKFSIIYIFAETVLPMSVKEFLKSKVFFKQVAIALGIIVVVVFVLLQWLSWTTNHGEKIQVPDRDHNALKFRKGIRQNQA